MRIKYNDDNNDLWCVDCKERIKIGVKYAEIVEKYQGEVIVKAYHLPACVPVEEEDLLIKDTNE